MPGRGRHTQAQTIARNFSSKEDISHARAATRCVAIWQCPFCRELADGDIGASRFVKHARAIPLTSIRLVSPSGRRRGIFSSEIIPCVIMPGQASTIIVNEAETARYCPASVELSADGGNRNHRSDIVVSAPATGVGSSRRASRKAGRPVSRQAGLR